MSTRILARLIFSSSKYCRHQKCYSFKHCDTLLPWFQDSHFDGSVSSNVRYITCSHGTDCYAESPAGRVQCFKMAKIDPVSPFYPTLWLKKAALQWDNLLGCKYLLLCVLKLEVFTQLLPAYYENCGTSMVSYKDSLPGMSLRASCRLISPAEKELTTSSNWKENKDVWEF